MYPMVSCCKIKGLLVVKVILLAVPSFAMLAVPYYDRVNPNLFGLPMFYWWQLLWVPLSAVFLGIVYAIEAVADRGA